MLVVCIVNTNKYIREEKVCRVPLFVLTIKEWVAGCVGERCVKEWCGREGGCGGVGEPWGAADRLRLFRGGREVYLDGW